VTLINDVLEGLRLQSSVFCRMTLSGDWGLAKSALAGAPFHLMLTGRAWLLKDDMEGALPLDPGDIVVLPRGEKHSLVSRPDADTVPFRQVADSMGLSPWMPGTRYKAVDLRLGTGSLTNTLISGVFDFSNHPRNPLLGALPSVMMMRATAGSAASNAVASITALLDAEMLSGMPGAESVSSRLADILFIQVVRHHLALADTLPQGWLRGITDKEIAPALALMHRAPERSWSVEALGREVGMSRSRFALRFHDVVGQAPLEYLTQWRMYQAAERLAEGKFALPTVAKLAGYQSEVSFSKAFKRWAGQSPAQYRRWLMKPNELSIDGREGSSVSASANLDDQF
jgi:AraC-like DNA-binding protein